MVSQGTVKLLSKSRVEMPLQSLCGRKKRQARRDLTYSFHGHQLSKLPNMIFNHKILKLSKEKNPKTIPKFT